MSGSLKIYLSKSNNASTQQIIAVKQYLNQYDVEIVEYYGLKWNNIEERKLTGCDALLIIPPENAFKGNHVTVGKGQYEQIVEYTDDFYYTEVANDIYDEDEREAEYLSNVFVVRQVIGKDMDVERIGMPDRIDHNWTHEYCKFQLLGAEDAEEVIGLPLKTKQQLIKERVKKEQFMDADVWMQTVGSWERNINPCAEISLDTASGSGFRYAEDYGHPVTVKPILATVLL